MDFGEEKLNISKKFFKMENGLFDWITKTKELGKPERKILNAVIRRTNGYDRVEARISIRMFAKMTEMESRNVWTYVKCLLDRKIILRRPGKKDKFGKPVYFYKINEKYRRYNHASTPENNASPDIESMPIPVVNRTPIKDFNNIKDVKTRENVKYLMNYKIHRDDKAVSTNENQKPEDKTENCGSKEN